MTRKKKPGRGGAREGAGRKATSTLVGVSVRVEPEVRDAFQKKAAKSGLSKAKFFAKTFA